MGKILGMLIFLFGVIGMLTGHNQVMWADEFDHSGFDALRIEQEDKLVVPDEKVEEVWSYLLRRLVEDKTFIKRLDDSFSSSWSDEYFVDDYFDTPDFVLLNKQSSVRHRRRLNLSDPDNRKSGRELIQIKLNGIDNNVFNRGELKYPVVYPDKFKTPEDTHPVIGKIQPKYREEFKQQMVKIGINPYSLKKILTNEQRRRSIYITRDGQPFISVRLDEGFSRILWARWRHVELEPELNEIAYTKAQAAEKGYLEDINKKIVSDILQRFPEIKRDLTPKYNKAFSCFESKLPWFRFLKRHNIL